MSDETPIRRSARTKSTTINYHDVSTSELEESNVSNVSVDSAQRSPIEFEGYQPSQSTSNAVALASISESDENTDNSSVLNLQTTADEFDVDDRAELELQQNAVVFNRRSNEFNVDDTIDPRTRVITYSKPSYESITQRSLAATSIEHASLYRNICDALADLNIDVPERFEPDDSTYDDSWVSICHTMLLNSGVPADADTDAEFLRLSRKYAKEMRENYELRIDWEYPYYRNDDGDVVRSGKAVPVLRSHIGRSSIEGSGVTNQDIYDLLDIQLDTHMPTGPSQIFAHTICA